MGKCDFNVERSNLFHDKIVYFNSTSAIYPYMFHVMCKACICSYAGMGSLYLSGPL